MARYTGPKCRLCRAERAKLFLKGQRCTSAHCPMNNPSECGLPGRDPRARSRKPTDYGMMLREKQKMKRLYCMLEKQFYITFQEAAKMPGKTGESLIKLLECRLDNLVFRMHYAASRAQAAQLVNHGHIFVNGKRVDIPSCRLKVGDVVTLSPKAQKMALIKDNLAELSKNGTVPWITLDVDAMKGTFNAIPQRSEVKELENINEQLVVELYSR